MPGSAWPRRGHIELAMTWGWPNVQWFGCCKDLCRLGHCLTLLLPPHDDRWPASPMAVLLNASLDEDAVVVDAHRKVARIPESVWRRSQHALREPMVAKSVAPTQILGVLTDPSCAGSRFEAFSRVGGHCYAQVFVTPHA